MRYELYEHGENMNKEREPRDRRNLDVINASMRKEKLSGEDLIELAQYVLDYPPFTHELLATDTPILTVKQFTLYLAKEMSYHRDLDEIEGIA